MGQPLLRRLLSSINGLGDMAVELMLPDPATSFTRKGRLFRIGPSGIQLALGKPTVVFCSEVEIVGSNRAPGQDVYIIADRVIASSAILDVSGEPASTSYDKNNKAPNASRPGDPGIDADKATNLPRATAGGNGGNIVIICRSLAGTLTLRSNGGQGGDGLSGGDGAQGPIGPSGPDRQENPSLAVGGLGLTGGKAGDGGQAGPGGNGGKVIVRAILNTASLDTEVKYGMAGTPGSPGTRGPPGQGGLGGSYGHMEFINLHPVR